MDLHDEQPDDPVGEQKLSDEDVFTYVLGHVVFAAALALIVVFIIHGMQGQ